MSPQQVRIYCSRCRRRLTPKAFNLQQWDGLGFRVCKDCISQLEEQGVMVTSQITIETESVIKLILQEREGGETEVETPAGLIDLLTDSEVIEIKHVKDWKDGTKVLVYAHYFGDRKPRIHLFGGYNKRFRQMVEEVLTALNIVVTWEREPY